MLLLVTLWGDYARSVSNGMTLPGLNYSLWVVFFSEITITFLLVLTIFIFVSHHRLMRWTPLVVWLLIAGMVWQEAPISGTVAVAYYWVVVPIYMLFPAYAYYLMELIEGHAYHTYDEYLQTNEAQLKAQKAPQVAINFYRDGDLYMFDEVQTAPGHEFRRPKVDNLYDVFVNIRDDESEHVKTMVALQKPEARLTFKSPHTVFEAAKVLSSEAEV
ncbi:alternative oxidase [Nostoc sp.]|uniref:alternative oxidase n=1 Tax=Nostoc sp. TaxID=1180 RepID=UPI002FF9ED8D